MRRLALVCVAAIAVVLTACGGDDEQDVRNAIGRFASATETEDARAACRAVTPRTRDLLDRLAAARLGTPGCETLLRARFAESGGASFAIDATTLAAVEEAEVDIDGDVAEVDTFGEREHVPLRRSDGEWRLDLIGIPAQGYSLSASVACTERDVRLLSAPLPSPSRAGYAAFTRRMAVRAEALAEEIGRLRPPRGEEEAHGTYVAGLRTQARELRRVAKAVAGNGPVLEAASSRTGALRAVERRMLAAQERLEVACDPSASRRGAAAYRTSGERICRAVSRRIQRLGEPANPAGLGAYMRRVRGAGAGASTGLRGLRPPNGLAQLHRRTVAAYDEALDAIGAIARGTDPKAAYDRYGLRSLRAAAGFSRLGLPTCASL